MLLQRLCCWHGQAGCLLQREGDNAGSHRLGPTASRVFHGLIPCKGPSLPQGTGAGSPAQDEGLKAIVVKSRKRNRSITEQQQGGGDTFSVCFSPLIVTCCHILWSRQAGVACTVQSSTAYCNFILPLIFALFSHEKISRLKNCRKKWPLIILRNASFSEVNSQG